MKPNLLRALSILLGLTLLVIGIVYWVDFSRQTGTDFSTAYSPDYKSAPMEDPANLVEVPGVIRAFDVTRNGSRAAIATSKAIMLYDLKTLKELSRFPVGEKVLQVRFSPNGAQLAVSSLDMKYLDSGPMSITVYDISSWQSVYEYESEPGIYVYYAIGTVAWSPDGKRLAFSIPQSGLIAAEVATGKISSMSAESFYPHFDLSWSPDGTRLVATNDYGNGLRRWRVDTNQWVRLWDVRIQPAMQVKWSPDGTQIASGHRTGVVMVWNTQNNQCEGLIRAHFNSVDALEWLPGGGQFATASGAIRTWDSHTGEMLSAFGYHDEIRYRQLRWIEPQTIVTLETAYTQDLPATVRFWDVSTGNMKLAFRGWDDAITDIGFVALRLDDVKVFKDRTEMQVSLLFDPSGEISLASDWTILATDSQGKTYPLKNITPATMDANVARIYQTVPLPKGEQIRLELKSTQPVQGLPIGQSASSYPEQRAEFFFDPAKLQTGEAVKLNKEFDMYGWMRLTGAQKIAANELIFEFNAQNSPDFFGVDLSAPNVTDSSFRMLDKNNFAVTVTFSKIPTQPVQIQIAKIYYVVNAVWSFDFHVVKSMFAE